MKFTTTTIIAAAAVTLIASSSLAQAGCDFFSEQGKKGDKLVMKDGECAILGTASSTGCEGYKLKEVSGWNDKIQSIQLNHNSKAYLMQHEDGSGMNQEFSGKSGRSTLGEMNLHSSVARCYK